MIKFENYVITTIEDRAAKREYQLRSNHMIACDGARSRVRESLGINCEGSATGTYIPSCLTFGASY